MKNKQLIPSPRLILRWGAAALALLSISCAPAQELNSERIQRLFGSYGVAIVHQTDQRRVSDLYSLHGDQRISRTFAIVDFIVPMPAELETAHGEIVAGGSLGATLQQAGWSVEKASLYIGTLDVAIDDADLVRPMNLDAPVTLAMHAYRLSARRGTDHADYATIVELYHPELHTEATLRDAFQYTAGLDESMRRERYTALVLSALAP